MKTIRRPGTMPRWQRWTFWWVAGLCLCSGLGYLLGHEFVLGPKWWSHRNMLSIHGVFAGLMLFVLGTIATGHIRVGWMLRRNRLTGVGNVLAMILLALTGWGLYYGSEEVRDFAVWLHWVVGLVLVGLLCLHLKPRSIGSIDTIHGTSPKPSL